MNSSDTIIRVAAAEVGYHEGYSGGHWNNDQKFSPAVPGLEWSNRQAWCATFVSWCAMKAGLASLYPRTASTDLGARWFKDRGQWSEYPAIGAQVFFGVGNDMNHTGLVYDYDSTWIYTIEGNTNTSGSREGDGVYRKKRRRRDSYVRGYGYPAFPEGIKSADPNPPVPQPHAVASKEEKPVTLAHPNKSDPNYGKTQGAPIEDAKALLRQSRNKPTTSAKKRAAIDSILRQIRTTLPWWAEGK